MQARSTAFPSERIAQRWADLTGRRRSHFIELFESGRWKHYYSEADFAVRMQEACRAAEQWESWPLRSTPPADFLTPHKSSLACRGLNLNLRFS